MRHWVNFGLLFSFTTLLVSGVMVFYRPFSLVTTRVHVVFGLLTMLLVALHLVSRTRYFTTHFKGKGKSLTRRGLVMICLTWAALLALTLVGGGIVQALLAQSYESTNRQDIVRASPLAGFIDDDQKRYVARKLESQDDAAVAMIVRLREGLQSAPAMVIWAETTSGTLIETLYIDTAFAYSEETNWNGTQVARHRVLPIWRHRYTMVSGVDPKGEVDAYSGATDTHSFSLDSYLDLGESKEFVICVEVNMPEDANESYTDEVIGQPSLLYTAYVDVSEGGYSLLELTGQGGADADGTIHYDFDKLDLKASPIDLLLVKTGKIEP